ncbi:serine hydrolase [Streptomyces sp. NPDC127106]|uniref:serine hydrolase n=1 Tax=Streptomyces sp. NPDC127106 TaxID=3345360 RepID=UPI0036346AEA
MKAMTVAGGSPDDPKVDGTTTAGTGTADTSTEPDTIAVAETEDTPAVASPTADDTADADAEDNADADADAEDNAEADADSEDNAEAEAGEPEPACDTGQQETDAGADRTGPDSSPARGTATPVAQAEDTADTRSDAEDDAHTEAGAAQAGTEPEADAAGDADTEAEAAVQTADDTQVLPIPARTAAKPEPAPGAEAPGAEAPSAPDAAAAAGNGKDTEPEPDDAPATRTGTASEADEKADGRLTPTESARDRAGTEDTSASEADSDGGGEDTRTVVFRAPDAAATGRKPKADAEADVATETSGDGGKTRREANKEPWPSAKAAGADTGSGPDTDTDTDTKAKAKGEGDGRRVPAWARGEESDSERTSKIVALRPLDVPAPAAPRPHQQPQATAPTTAKPALDLLAELTNTPPPAETLRRTALRRVKVWTPILLLVAGAYTGAQLLRPLPAPRLVAAEATHTVDGRFSVPWPDKGQGAVRVPGSGEIGTFGEQKPVPTASVAKVMTAYVILKGHPLRKNEPGPDITVDAKAVADGNSENESRIMGLTAGTKFSELDMLKMLMIPSGNNVARLLARWDGGSDSEAAFVAKMNAAAKELGMKDTTYTDPSGLDAGTVSTATDQLKLAEAVMKDEVFRTIVAMPSAPVKGVAEPLVNNNDLLSVQGLSVRGIKTGSSTPAGGTLMWAAYKSVGDETPLILGTLMEQRVDGPDENAKKSLALVLTNSKKIIEAVRAALASTPLVRKGDRVGYVDDGLGGRTPLVATKDLNVIGVPGQRFKLTVAAAGASPLPHAAKAGTEIGTLTAGEGEGAKSVPVAVQHALTEPSVGSRLTRLG